MEKDVEGPIGSQGLVLHWELHDKKIALILNLRAKRIRFRKIYLHNIISVTGSNLSNS
jgi:hypothetical protein